MWLLSSTTPTRGAPSRELKCLMSNIQRATTPPLPLTMVRMNRSTAGGRMSTMMTTTILMITATLSLTMATVSLTAMESIMATPALTVTPILTDTPTLTTTRKNNISRQGTTRSSTIITIIGTHTTTKCSLVGPRRRRGSSLFRLLLLSRRDHSQNRLSSEASLRNKSKNSSPPGCLLSSQDQSRTTCWVTLLATKRRLTSMSTLTTSLT